MGEGSGGGTHGVQTGCMETPYRLEVSSIWCVSTSYLSVSLGFRAKFDHPLRKRG